MHEIPEQEIDKLTPGEAKTLKAVAGVGLVAFTAFMMVNWQRVLSQHALAEAQQAETTEVAKKPAASSTAPSTTTTTSSATTSSTTASSAEDSPAAESTVSTSSTSSETPSQLAGTPATTVAAATSDASDSESAGSVTGSVTTGDVSESTIATSDIEESEPAARITNSEQVQTLNESLYEKVDQAWTEVPTFTNNLVYLVKVQSDGIVSEYQPINQSAIDFLNETPMDQVTNETAASASKPVADFVVVLTPSGQLEVSPWIAE
ncbi:MAG: hypothetical protein ACFBSC_06515 [Microcoleaceae cyanobacterium]